MGLNVELVSQFAKLTANKKETKKESTAWGEVVEITDSGKCFVKLDGSDRVTPVEMTTEAKPGDRVSVTIRNHAATLTGNTSSPSINADGSTVRSIRTDFENLSTDNLLIRGELTASTGRIDSLVAKDVEIENTLTANVGKFAELEADIADINRLNADFVTTEQLSAKEAEIRSLFVDYATIENLNAKDAEIRNLFADYATVESLKATNAAVGNLTADVGDINTLIFGSASGKIIHANFANAVISTLGEAWIGDAMIDNVSAYKITAGDIITDKVKVKSNDGKLLIEDQTIQISDNSKVRVQIGKDASNDYSINIWDANGKLMFSKGGLTEDAVKEQIIRNDMVKDDANISASKLDIDTLFKVINDDGSHTLKSSKVKLDEEGQTLDVAFKSMTTKIDGISVGGRNLLLNTGRDGVIRLNTVDAARYLPTVVPTNVGGLLTLECSSLALPDPEEIYYRFMIPLMAGNGSNMYGLEIGETYTLSGKAKVSTTSGALTEVVARSQDRVGGSWSSDIKTVITETDSDEWISFKSTFTIRENAECCYTSIQVYYEGSWTGVVQLKDLKFEKGSMATDWTPAPEDVDATTTELFSKYHDLTVDIDGLSSTIANQSQLIDKKADGETVSTLSTNYLDLKVEVDGINATVASHTSQIKDKADGITVATLTDNYVALSGTLDGINTRVGKTETDILGINVDGRNLLVNTGRDGVIRLNAADKVSVSKLTHTNESGLLTLNCSSSSTLNEIYYRFMPPVTTQENMYGLKKGGTYTFSGKAKVSTTSGVLKEVIARSQDFIGGWGNETLTVITTTDSDEWISFESTFTIRENATCCYISIQANFESSWAGVIQLKDLKFEKGSKATDWTPAPEDGGFADVDAAIVKSAETVTTQTAELLGSYATKVDLNGYYTKSQTESAIEQKADSITSTVASTYSTKADLAALEVGGRNLIANTSLDTVYSGVINPDIGYRDIWSAKTIDIPVGTEYIVSFDAKADEEMDIRCFFYSPNTTLTSESSTGDRRNNVTDGMSVVHITAEWKRYWVKWTQTPADTKKNVIVGRHSSSTNSVYIRAVKLEAGNKATDWTPAPEDVDTEFGSVRSEIQQLADSITLSVEDIDTEFGSVRSEIKQLADSITLSVTGSIGSEASIKLSVNGEITTQKIDMTDVRTAFANDTSAIDISAGTITFNSGTLIVNSENFILDKDGNLEATSAKLDKAEITNATITGVFINRDDYGDGVRMYGGSISMLYGNETPGRISSRYLDYSSTIYGLCLWLPAMGMLSGKDSVLLWGHDEYLEDGRISHICDYSMEGFSLEEDVNNPNTFRHHFNTSAYFLGRVHFGSTSYFHTSYFLNQNALGWYESDGSQTQLLIVGSDDIFKVGHTSLDTTLQGDIITVTAKDKVELKNGVETIRFYGASTTSGTNTGYIHSTNAGKCALGIAAYPWYRVYATNTSIGTSDRRLKENIIGLTDIHSKLFDKLQPVEYNFIDGDGRTSFGLIAQDVIFAMNELGLDEDKLDLVHHDMNVNNETGELNDTYGIAYTNLIAMLIHEVQKLKQEITILKGE